MVEMFAGQTSEPPVIFTMKLHVTMVFPEVSVAAQVTVVVPTGNADPDTGSQLTKPQLPIWVGEA